MNNAEDRVYDQVVRCMKSMLTDGGQAASASLMSRSFQLIRTAPAPGGNHRHYFRVKGWLIPEFEPEPEFEPDSGRLIPDKFEGSITLDDQFRLVRDEQGRVLIEPWACQDPDAEHKEPDPFGQFFKE